jgi:prepilin-type N-terminal cleavage/methylation domain-containing protein/prepilin-type processing-associated H-X9-DG protein
MRNRRAFTLIELLVVVAIIALLATILSAVVLRMFENTRRAKCAGTLGQIAKAFTLYADANNDRLAGTANWWRDVAPFLNVRMANDSDSLPTEADISRAKAMLCDSARKRHGKADPLKLISYGRNHELDINDDDKPDDSPLTLSMKNPSQTMLLGDAPREGDTWKRLLKYPDFRPEPPAEVYRSHDGDGVNFSFADGRAAWFPLKDVPPDPANTNLARRTSTYFNGTFWLGIAE